MTNEFSDAGGPAVCLLRQMRSVGPCQVPPPEVIQALTAPDRVGCHIGDCLIRGADLLRCEYASEAVSDIPFQEPKELAAPDCALFESLEMGGSASPPLES